MWSLILCFGAGLVLGYILGMYSLVESLLGTMVDWIIENLFRLFR